MHCIVQIQEGSGRALAIASPLGDKPMPDYLPHFLRIVNVDIIGPTAPIKPI
jgi:hypothetical protein